jgi:3-hydroxyacyl-CoA dehydrogenase
MIAVDDVRHVAVIGGGTIGASWTAFFLRRGFAVSVYDVEAGRRRYVEEYIQNAWPALDSVRGNGRRPPAQWAFHERLRNAVAGAQFVQESVSETVEIKRAVFRELDDCCAPRW